MWRGWFQIVTSFFKNLTYGSILLFHYMRLWNMNKVMIPLYCASAMGHISVGGSALQAGMRPSRCEGFLIVADGWQMGKSYQGECHSVMPCSYLLYLSSCYWLLSETDFSLVRYGTLYGLLLRSSWLEQTKCAQIAPAWNIACVPL